MRHDDEFFLGRVPSGAAGGFLNIYLFDIGDAATYGGSITIIPPTGSDYTGCTGWGVTTSISSTVAPSPSPTSAKLQLVVQRQ